MPCGVALPIGEQVAMPLVLALGGGLLVWFFAGNELMRRRAHRLAVWCKRATDPLGGTQAIRWLTVHSFRIEVQEPRAPFRAAAITGLTESLEVPAIWLWNRRRGRRDMVLFEATLRRRPIWGLELYRPGGLLAGDARHHIRAEGWTEAAQDELRLAPAEGVPRALAAELLAALEAQRPNLVRLTVRRGGPHLALALNVPDRAALPPEQFHRLVERLARAVLHHATPGVVES
jgi:hypothetical protein